MGAIQFFPVGSLWLERSTPISLHMDLKQLFPGRNIY